MVLAISKNRVHLWLAFPDQIQEPILLQKYCELMDPEETQKQQRFRFAKHRHQYLVSRALVRTVLSRYEPRAPEKWDFHYNAYGRPEIAPGQSASLLRFNLSKTEGLIACAVTIERDVGVDVETIDPTVETVSIASRYFSQFEVQSLRHLLDKKQERFYQYWTLKESYIKARGMGLALPLDQFSFHLDERGPIRISFGPHLSDDPGDWQFNQLRPTGNQFLALCIRRGRQRDLDICGFQTVPLADPEHPVELFGVNSRIRES